VINENMSGLCGALRSTTTARKKSTAGGLGKEKLGPKKVGYHLHGL